MRKQFYHEMSKIKENGALAVKENENLKDIKGMYAQSLLTGQVTMDRRAEVYWHDSSYRGA